MIALDAAVKLPIVEGLLGVGLFFYVRSKWDDRGEVGTRDEKVSQRQLSSTIIVGEVTAIINASTFIFVALAALIALKSSFEEYQKFCLGYSVTWFLIAVALSVWTLSTVGYHAGKTDPMAVRSIALALLVCTMLVAFGCARLLVAAWLILL